MNDSGSSLCLTVGSTVCLPMDSVVFLMIMYPRIVGAVVHIASRRCFYLVRI
jgi:hypothetical protein